MFIAFSFSILMSQELKKWSSSQRTFKLKNGVVACSWEEHKKEGAMVYGYDKSGKLCIARKGEKNKFGPCMVISK